MGSEVEQIFDRGFGSMASRPGPLERPRRRARRVNVDVSEGVGAA